MLLVMLAALFAALLFMVFKVFELRNVPVLPAIVINYFTAMAIGALVVQPWVEPVPRTLLLPALGLGALFIGLFYLSARSTVRAGVATTSVASKTSLVLTVLFAVVVLHDRPGVMGWIGILLAIISVASASFGSGGKGARGVWLLPVLLFFGSAAIDITLSYVQRTMLTIATEGVFPMMAFGVAGMIGALVLIGQRKQRALLAPRSLIGGVVLGSVNYESLYFVIGALARSGFQASTVFPLMNIGVILFSTALSLILFKERLLRMQWSGIILAVIAMGLILCDE